MVLAMIILYTPKHKQQKQKPTSRITSKKKFPLIKTNNKMKWESTKWEKISPNHISDKGLISKYTNNLYNSTAKKKK